MTPAEQVGKAAMSGFAQYEKRIAELEAKLAFNKETLDMVFNQRDEALRQVAVLRVALKKLACLGNGDRHGNSLGNDIAIAALFTTPSPGVLCESEPVAWVRGGRVSYKDRDISGLPDGTQLYRKKEMK